MNHYPFDYGVLAELGRLTHQKTIKAICGKRVAFNHESSKKHIDCEACRKSLRDDADLLREFIGNQEANAVRTLAINELNRIEGALNK